MGGGEEAARSGWGCGGQRGGVLALQVPLSHEMLLCKASAVCWDVGMSCGRQLGETELCKSQLWSDVSSAWCLCLIPP